MFQTFLFRQRARHARFHKQFPVILKQDMASQTCCQGPIRLFVRRGHKNCYQRTLFPSQGPVALNQGLAKGFFLGPCFLGFFCDRATPSLPKEHFPVSSASISRFPAPLSRQKWCVATVAFVQLSCFVQTSCNLRATFVLRASFVQPSCNIRGSCNLRATFMLRATFVQPSCNLRATFMLRATFVQPSCCVCGWWFPLVCLFFVFSVFPFF